MSFFLPVFRTSIAVTETFPIPSNPSSHGPGRYAKHCMGSFAYASSTTFFARQNCIVSQRYITQLFPLSSLWWGTLMEKMLTTVVEFALPFLLTKRERELLTAIFWRNLKQSTIKTSGKTMAFPVQCVTHTLPPQSWSDVEKGFSHQSEPPSFKETSPFPFNI